MRLTTALLTLFFALLQVPASAQSPTAGSPLPPLKIEDRGEILLQGDDFSFAPWSSEQQPGKVHILQYFGATRSDSKRFKPFTDLLEQTFAQGQYHVTTILNLDAALWGTSGLVVSEVKDNKRRYPGSTMVLDENGTGVEAWELGDDGTGLVIMDAQGTVQYFTRGNLDEGQMQSSLELVKNHVEACEEAC
jgi:YtfJ family uncharacterized protein